MANEKNKSPFLRKIYQMIFRINIGWRRGTNRLQFIVNSAREIFRGRRKFSQKRNKYAVNRIGNKGLLRREVIDVFLKK